MNKYISLYIILIISLLLFSCKTKKNLVDVKKTEMLQVYDSIVSKYLNYETLYLKSSVKYYSEKKNLNLKASIKIKKDSIIIISLSPGLGIEVARIMLTNDSVFILDRLSSQCTKADYKYFTDEYKIDVMYSDIQSILTNELFILPKNDLKTSNDFIQNFNFGNGANKYNFYRKTNNSIENLISIDSHNYFIQKYLIIDIPKKRNLTINYIDNYSKEFSNFPKKIDIISSFNGNENKILLNYSKIGLNKKLNFSFKIPSKYKIIYIKK